MLKKYVNQNFPNERDLYNSHNVELENCTFSGVEDGESALKESSQITMNNCYMDLRYPLWHVEKLNMSGCTQTQNCRAALWYVKDADINNSTLGGIKALRECSEINIEGCNINSAEFGWKCSDVCIKNSKITSEYAFLNSENLCLEKVEFSGKYSFQYCKHVQIKNSILNTKDAFWHAEKVTVENCEVTGEYIGWYSKDLTFINCKIKGTQPFCYCESLRLINCEMQDADLAFEYSDAVADLKGKLISIKNFSKGTITVDEVGEIIVGNNVRPVNGKIIQRNKKDAL